MSAHKILKIFAAVLGLAGIIFLVRIIARGDEVIRAEALSGDTSIVDPMAWVTYIIFSVTVFFVLFFVLKNLFTHTSALKNTLIGFGAFVAVLVIAYFLSGGDTGIYKYNGAQVSDGASHWVGAGLMAFYILISGAAVAMVFAGIKKMTT